ncbi:MAG: hypothetical protein KAI34_01610 [Candidatus Lokiarchaeota archaeon]|nr:hypothetical protein [Candidatus Lokiarchaeota archaeon]
MGIWNRQNNTEKQIRLSYSIKKAIAQLEKRRAQLEKLFRQKYIAAQEAKNLGDKEEAIRLLEECQMIDEESKTVKNELMKLSRAESMIEYIIILPEVSAFLGTTSSSEEIDPARVLGIVSNLEQHIKQTREADEKLGTLPTGIDTQGLPSPPMGKTKESESPEELSQEIESNSIQSEDVSDSNQKSTDASKKGKETEE